MRIIWQNFVIVGWLIVKKDFSCYWFIYDDDDGDDDDDDDDDDDYHYYYHYYYLFSPWGGEGYACMYKVGQKISNYNGRIVSSDD